MAVNGFIDVSGVTYCGKEYGDIWSHDLYDLDLRQVGVTYMDLVKGKTKLTTGELGDLYQSYNCDFTPEGSVVLGEWYFEPEAIKINLEECYDKFWNTYLVDQTEISLRGGVPQNFADWFFAKFRAKASAEYQEIFWQGDTDYSGSTKQYLKVIDGIEKQLDDNSGVTKVSGAAITIDNVIAQVEAVIMAGLNVAAEANVSAENYKIIMNHNDVRLLEVALGKLCCGNSTSQVFGNYTRENGRVHVMGYEVIPSMVSRNTIIFGNPKSLILGFDTYDSHLEYKFIDMRNTTGQNMFRILTISNIAAAIVFPELFVVSKP